MTHWKSTLTLGLLLIMSTGAAQARPLRIVTTIPDLSDIAARIGGNQVTASSLVTGTQDPHFIEPRPSMVARVRRADLFIVVGMELDAWAFSLIDAARNRGITPGKPGYLNSSAMIRKLDVLEPGTRIDASRGHVHPSGNPHYLLDPMNGVVVAETIALRLSELRPEATDYFTKNLASFRNEAETLNREIAESLAGYGQIRILTYHENWAYFGERFGIEIAGILEPLPGISPTSRHLNHIVNLARDQEIDLILQASFYDQRAAEFVSRQTNIPIVVAPAYVGGMEGADDYFTMFRLIKDKITIGLEKR